MQQTEKHSQRKRLWRWFIALILLGAAVVVAIEIGNRRSPESPRHERAGHAPPPIPVVTTQVREGNIGVYVQALGTVVPLQTASITARVQGEIMSVSYKEGQRVQRGDPLVQIDPRPYAAAVLQVEGQLARDTAVLREARIDLQRYRRAYAHNAIQKQLLDDQEQIVLQDEGSVKADQGALATARVNLEYCHISSPVTGRVGLRLIDPGNVIQPGSTAPLAVVTQLQPISVIFSVAEDYLPSIQASIRDQLRTGGAMDVEILDRAQENKIADGKFLSLDNQIDTTTGTVRIRAVFDNKDERLFPNEFVNARLLLKTLRGVNLVSAPAIQRGPQGSYVYVIKPDGTAEMRNVKVEVTEANEAAVTGINPGEVVATSGFDKLEPGVRVEAATQLAGQRP